MTELLVGLFAPWAKLYGDHTAIATAVAFVHLSGLLWGGGRAVTADVLTLRAPSLARFIGGGHLDFLRASHRDVLIGLSLSLGSGILQFGADVEHFMGSPLFWAKLATVAVLLGNGALLQRFEAGIGAPGEGAERAWSRTRRHAGISLICWFGATLLGQALVSS